MARTRRRTYGGVVYHVLNRAARKTQIFRTEQDYDAFLRIVREALKRVPVRIFAYIVMPNHWHFLIQPLGDGDLSRFAHWLATTHSRRWNIAHDKCGEGAVYQSRFRAVAVQEGMHLLRVWRYIERNALRANLVRRAEDWQWSSLAIPRESNGVLSEAPIRLPIDWIEVVNMPQTEPELQAIRAATERERAFGDSAWQHAIAERGGRERVARGRPSRRVTYEKRKNGV
jgi:REP-associated tyrosine transposase